MATTEQARGQTHVKRDLKPAAMEICKDIGMASSWIALANKKRLVKFLQDHNAPIPEEPAPISEEQIRKIVREEIGRILSLMGEKMRLF